MQHIRLELPHQAPEMKPGQEVGGMRLPANRNTKRTKRQLWCDLRQCGIRTLATGEAVSENADMMAAIGLPPGEIKDVAKNSADRRAHGMQNPKRSVSGCAHHQNQRSPTTMVSPGLSGVPSGTMVRTVPPASVWVSVTRSRLARGEKPPAIATALSTLMLGTNGYCPGAATSPRMKNGR